MNYNGSEKNISPSPSRRKFVFGLGLISFLSAAVAAVRIPFLGKRNIIACTPEDKPKKVKMLMQDGSLVEIDDHFIPADRRKITDTELQHWIKHKNSK